MSTNALVVRAIDVGYGHIKFTDGCDPSDKGIRTDSIPSQSPVAQTDSIAGPGVLAKRDTFLIPIGDRLFEVGRDIRLALHGNQITEDLSADFCLSDGYAARLFGAINYMQLPHDVIDVLVLGLPITTYQKHHQTLAKRFVGPHKINSRSASVRIGHCHVYPQPLGSYMAYLASEAATSQAPHALVVDPGYNTFDWFVCHGMSANAANSGAVERGMGAVLRAIADDIIKSTPGIDAAPMDLVRAIDRSLANGQPLRLYGQQFDLAPHLAAGAPIFEEAARALRNAVRSSAELDVIVLTGGGAALYADAIKDKFPRHAVVTLAEPATANVRGFQLIGDMLAKSLGQALRLQEGAVA